MLVVVALAAGTRGAGRIGRARDVYAGAVAAIFASIILAWAVNHLITDDASDTLEGVFQLFAAATLFYVSSWMTSKGQSDRWMKFISHKLESAEQQHDSRHRARADRVSRRDARGSRDDRVLPGAHQRRDRNCRASRGRGRHRRRRSRAGRIVRGHQARRRSNPDEDFLPRDFDHALRAGDRVRRPGRRQSAGSVCRIPRPSSNYAPTIPMLGIFPTIQSLGAQAALLMLALALRVRSARAGTRDGQGCGAGGDAAGAAGLDCSSGASATESAPPNRTVSTSELSFSETTSARNPIRMH